MTSLPRTGTFVMSRTGERASVMGHLGEKPDRRLGAQFSKPIGVFAGGWRDRCALHGFVRAFCSDRVFRR
jgi:hypothetical protein